MAAKQLSECTHPQIQHFLKTIVQDETAHAELAWDTLRWCLAMGGGAVEVCLNRVFGEPFTPSAMEFPLQGIEGTGLISRSDMEKCLHAGWEQVIQPSARSLLNAYKANVA